MSKPYSDDLRISAPVSAVAGGLSRPQGVRRCSAFGVFERDPLGAQSTTQTGEAYRPIADGRASRGTRIEGADREWLLERDQKPSRDLTLERTAARVWPSSGDLWWGYGSVWRFLRS